MKHRLAILFVVACPAMGCFTYDTTPPLLVASPFDEQTPWLHDPLWFDFDDDIDFASWQQNARIELADGSPLPTRHWFARNDQSMVGIGVETSVVAAGELRVTIDGVVDTADNPFEPLILEWTLDEWTIDASAFDLGIEPGPPVIEVLSTALGEDSSVVVAWTVGDAEARQITGVTRYGEWREMGEHEAERSVEIDGAVLWSALVVLPDAAEAAKWGTSWDSESDYNYFDAVAATPLHRHIALASAGSTIPVEIHGGYTFDPVVLPEIIPDDYGLAVDVALPSEEAPIVAFLDRGTDLDEVVKVTAYADGTWQEWAARRAPEASAMSLVANDDGAYVVWTDESGPHLVRAFAGGLVDLPLPAAGVSPRLGIDGDGTVIATWVDGGTTGRLASWDGVAWQDVTGPWVDGATGVDAPSFAMWDGRSPVVAWRENGEVRIALYNGPVP